MYPFPAFEFESFKGGRVAESIWLRRAGRLGYNLKSNCSSFESSKAVKGPLKPATATVPGCGAVPADLDSGSALSSAAGFGSIAGWLALWTVEQAIEQLPHISLTIFDLWRAYYGRKQRVHLYLDSFSLQTPQTFLVKTLLGLFCSVSAGEPSRTPSQLLSSMAVAGGLCTSP